RLIERTQNKEARLLTAGINTSASDRLVIAFSEFLCSLQGKSPAAAVALLRSYGPMLETASRQPTTAKHGSRPAPSAMTEPAVTARLPVSSHENQTSSIMSVFFGNQSSRTVACANSIANPVRRSRKGFQTTTSTPPSFAPAGYFPVPTVRPVFAASQCNASPK